MSCNKVLASRPEPTWGNNSATRNTNHGKNFSQENLLAREPSRRCPVLTGHGHVVRSVRWGSFPQFGCCAETWYNLVLPGVGRKGLLPFCFLLFRASARGVHAMRSVNQTAMTERVNVIRQNRAAVVVAGGTLRAHSPCCLHAQTGKCRASKRGYACYAWPTGLGRFDRCDQMRLACSSRRLSGGSSRIG
jgi:hypothetical protein